MPLTLENNFNRETELAPNERAFKMNDTNEIVAVPAHLSDTEVESFFQTQRQAQDEGTKNAEILRQHPEVAAVLPDYYKQNFETPLKALQTKEMIEPNFIVEGIENRARAFNTAWMGSFGVQKKGYSGELDIESTKKYPGAALIGGLTAQLPAMMASWGLGEALGIGKLAGMAGKAMDLPISVPMAKQAVQALVSGVLQGGLFGGLSETERQVVSGENDFHKVGKAILDSGVMFGEYGVAGLIPSRIVGTTAIGGLTYALGKAQGQSEEENLLNSVAMMALHNVMGGGDHKESLQAVVEAETAYVQSKNSGVNKNVAADIVDTHISEKAKDIISKIQKEAELPKDLQPAPETGIDVNVTPEMKGAVDIIPGNAEGKIGNRSVMDKAISDLTDGKITQEQFDAIAKDALTVKPSVSTEIKSPIEIVATSPKMTTELIKDIVKEINPEVKETKSTKTNAPVIEGTSESVNRNIENIGNAFDSPSFSEKGFSGLDTPTQRAVMSNVISALHDSKVRDSVVKFIPVDVVNDLARIEPSSKMLFHDESMFNGSLSVKVKDSISIPINTADTLVRVVAGLRAEKPLGNFNLTRESSKGLSALGASGKGHDNTLTQKSGSVQEVNKSPEQPIGDKTAKAARDINKKIVDQGVAELPESELAKYESTSFKKQAEDFSDLMTSDPQATKDMATGKRAFPDGISPQLGFNAVKIKAILDGDMDLVKELIKSPVASERSQHAQELGAAGFDNGIKEADPIKAGGEIIKAREESSKHLTQKVADLETKLSEAEKKLADMAVKKSSEKAVKTVKSKEFGSKNKLVTKEMADEAVKKFFSVGKMRGSAFGVDILAEKMIEAGKIGTFYFEGGIRDFAGWSKTMTDVLGKEITPHLKDLWKKMTRSYYKAEREELINKVTVQMAEKESAIEIPGVIQKLAENLVSDGVKDRKTLVDRMHGILVKFDPKITKRDVADAVSGYGKFKPLNPDEVKATLRDLKGQLQQVSKLEDLQNKKSPLKTGMERRTPSDEERALIKQVEEAKKKYGIETTDPAKQLKSALDSIKTRLTNQIADLEKQILENKKIVREKNSVVLDKEAQDLTAKRDALRKEFDRVFGKTKLSDEQRVKIATRALERSVADLEKRIKAGDIAPKGTTGVKVSTPGLEALRAKREALRKDLQDLRDIANPPKSDLQRLKDRLNKQSVDLEQKLKDMNFADKQKKTQPADAESDKQRSKVEQLRSAYKTAKEVSEGITPDEVKALVDMSKVIYESKAKMKPDFTWEKEQDGIDYASSQVAFKKYVGKLKKDAKGSGLVNPLTEKGAGDKYRAFVEDFKIVFNFIGDNSKAILGSLDNSFHGRQGNKALTNPKYSKAWLENFGQSFIDIWKTLKGDIGKASPVDVILGKDAISAGDKIMDAMMVDYYRSKNFLNGRYNKGVRLDIATGEEAFPTSAPSLIPILGRVFEASKIAYDAAAMRLRMKIADILFDVAEKSGKDMNDKQLIGDINQIANEMTGRGGLGRIGGGKAINRVFFAIKNAKSNVDFLLRPFYPRQSGFARKQAAINLASTVAMIGTTLAIAKAIDQDSTDLDPTGDMFGKIRIGKFIPIDITGGLSSLVILASRLLTGTTKNSSTGIKKKLGESFTSPDGADLLVNFTMNKLSPMAGAIRDYIRGRNYQGERPTAVSTVIGIVTPIPASNVIQLNSTDENVAVKVGALILDGLGFGMSVRDMGVNWSTANGKELLAFKAKVGNEKFKEANDKFNDIYSARMSTVLDNNSYKNLSDEDKQRIISKEKKQAQDKVFRMYNFRYKTERKDELPTIR